MFICLFAIGFVVALLDVMIPVFIGKVVTLVTESKPEELLATGLAMAARHGAGAAGAATGCFHNPAIADEPGDRGKCFSNRIRWQNHWHVSRQSWAFFQNDFAGRIATRVMQTDPQSRKTGLAAHRRLVHPDLWHFVANPARLGRPLARGAGNDVVCRLYRDAALFVPRMQRQVEGDVGSRSLLTGRIVDTYTNIVTVKLFARARDEDAYVREAVDHHTGRFHKSLRLNTLFALTLIFINALLITGTGAFAIVLWRHGHVSVGTVAMALPMTTQIISASHWVAWQVTDIFENIGVVQEGMMTIARPHTLLDRPDAGKLTSHARQDPI